MPTSELIEHLKKLFKEKLGVKYSNQEAYKASERLVEVFGWLIKEDKKQKGNQPKK